MLLSFAIDAVSSVALRSDIKKWSVGCCNLSKATTTHTPILLLF
mgnify:CR=1 FL=1